MNPRRLLPFLAIFIVLALTYAATQWHQARKERQEQEAKKLFHLKEADITELALIRGREAIRLQKQEQHWELVAPLKTPADQVAMTTALTALANLNRVREVGAPKDLGPFGLKDPAVLVEFTAQGQAHRLALGGKIPGDRGFYVLKDQDPQVYVISSADKESLDRPVAAWRDKTLLDFSPDQVEAIRLQAGKLQADLKKTGAGDWRWSGRDNLRVRRDRVESYLRHLTLTRIQDFVSEHPKEVRSYGLAPKPEAEITLTLKQGQQRLILGDKKNRSSYAWKGPGQPVVLVDQDLMQRTRQLFTSLEDRRLWSGDLKEVRKVVWGAPPKVWSAVREKDNWKLSGPDKEQLQQPAARVEMALWKFQELEHSRLLPKAPAPGQEKFVLELLDGAGKPLVRMAESDAPGKGIVTLHLQAGDRAETALVSQDAYRKWQEDMNRLITQPKKQ